VFLDQTGSDVDLVIKVPGALTNAERESAKRLFESHGFNGPLRVAKVRSDDERVFVLPDGVLSTLHDAHGLQCALVGVLRRKVLIVGDSPAWSEHTEPFA